MAINYLEIGKAPDIENVRERIFYRLLETSPAILSIGTLSLVFFFSWSRPAWVAIFIILFDLFWLCKISYLSFFQIASYKHMKKNLQIDWIKKLDKIESKNWQDVYHLIVLPFYKEPPEIIKSTCQALVDSGYPKEKMIVVLAAEERAGEEARQTTRIIENNYGQKFHHFLVTFHPADIKGEIAGKGSNVAWALQKAKEKIIKPEQYASENVIISSFDIDTKVYPQYFACLTWHYLTAKKPLRSSYQPIPVYNNNIWKAPAFSRVISCSGTFWQMMQQARPEQLVTYSSHSFPFKVFEEVGYPSNLVPDDSRIFWKSYFYYNGDYRVIPLFYPISMDAVMSENLLKTAVNQYKQQRRWAWGCSEIPYILYGFCQNKKISLKEKFRHSTIMFDGFWSWACASLLIFSLGWLPLILGGEKFKGTLLSYNLPRLTGDIMTVAMVGMLVSAILSLILLPPRPAGYTRMKHLGMVLQWAFLPVTLILFGSFPSLDAQLRLFFGKYMGFWVTEKVRR